MLKSQSLLAQIISLNPLSEAVELFRFAFIPHYNLALPMIGARSIVMAVLGILALFFFQKQEKYIEHVL